MIVIVFWVPVGELRTCHIGVLEWRHDLVEFEKLSISCFYEIAILRPVNHILTFGIGQLDVHVIAERCLNALSEIAACSANCHLDRRCRGHPIPARVWIHDNVHDNAVLVTRHVLVVNHFNHYRLIAIDICDLVTLVRDRQVFKGDLNAPSIDLHPTVYFIDLDGFINSSTKSTVMTDIIGTDSTNGLVYETTEFVLQFQFDLALITAFT
ncbi:hypothetical protein D3C86_1357150 [compost metagenome]